jgi:hypothetical protein
MRRRVYWLLPDLASARAAMDDLLLAHVALGHMHFLARNDCEMSGLPAANVLQTSDVLPSAEAGLVVGAGVGGLLGAIAAVSFPAVGEEPLWSLLPALVLGGALVDAWTASMIGISAPNRRLRRFTAQIEQSRILLMVDVPVRRVAEIEARLHALHPEGSLEASEPEMPAFL